MAPRSVVLLALLLAGSSSAFAQSPPAPTQTGTLYARLGGPEKIAAIASQAIDQLAAAPHSNQMAGGANLDDAKHLLAAQICALAGGDCVPGNDHFATSESRALVEELRHAMRAQDVPLAARNELLELLAPMHRDVARL